MRSRLCYFYQKIIILPWMFLISFSHVSSYQFLCMSLVCRATGYDTQENIIFIFTFIVAFAIYMFLLTLHSIRTNRTTNFMIYIFLYVYRNICYVYVHKMILSRISSERVQTTWPFNNLFRCTKIKCYLINFIEILKAVFTPGYPLYHTFKYFLDSCFNTNSRNNALQ